LKTPHAWCVNVPFSSCVFFQVRAQGWNYCFVVMTLDDCNYPRSSSEER